MPRKPVTGMSQLRCFSDFHPRADQWLLLQLCPLGGHDVLPLCHFQSSSGWAVVQPVFLHAFLPTTILGLLIVRPTNVIQPFLHSSSFHKVSTKRDASNIIFGLRLYRCCCLQKHMLATSSLYQWMALRSDKAAFCSQRSFNMFATCSVRKEKIGRGRERESEGQEQKQEHEQEHEQE